MAINVDTVYKTVLLILNKEQRGYMTPDEFNRVATQVQLDIFEQYFDDLNQQLRVPQSDYDYSDRQMSIDEKLSPFKTSGACVYSGSKFNFPVIEAGGGTVVYDGSEPTGSQVAFHSLGAVLYTPLTGFPTEIQRLARNEFYNIQQSPLTASTKDFPTYLYEGGKLTVSPSSINSSVSVSFLRKPKNVVWGYDIGSLGQYVYVSSGVPDSGTATSQIELNAGEQVNVISRILFYSGVIIRDPQVIQIAASEIQQNENNKKS